MRVMGRPRRSADEEREPGSRRGRRCTGEGRSVGGAGEDEAGALAGRSGRQGDPLRRKLETAEASR